MNLRQVPGMLAMFAMGLLTLAGCAKDDGLKIGDEEVTDQAKAPAVNVAESTEVDLVEKMAQARKSYQTYLKALQQYYLSKGFYDKQKWTQRELADFEKARKYVYLTLADLPPEGTTRSRDLIAEANDEYQDAWRLYRKNTRWPLIKDNDELREALAKFNKIIRQYPSSDKVDDAYFYAAEILKEHFNEEAQAVEYYRRAYEADPNTNLPVHFQRAVILDYRLHRRDEALAEYHLVLEQKKGRNEFEVSTNATFAARRIRQLTESDTPTSQ